jgi:spore coat polysaccharide biosynthesis protein SpsF
VIAAILQARMSSSRLPGKVLRPLCGKPTLAYMFERLEHSRSLDRFIVATSTDASDDPIEEFCASAGVTCHRGPLDDVAGRFLEVIDLFELSGFVRLTGDCPLQDQGLIDRGLELFSGGQYDVVTNVAPRTFPAGQSLEIVSADAFRRAYGLMSEPDEREHVTLFLYRHPELFGIHNLRASHDDSSIDVSLDTEQDANLIEAILARMDRPHWDYSSDEIVALYRGVQAVSAS